VTIVEVTLALAIVTTVLTASAGAFMSNLSTARTAQRISRATLFLETVMQDLSAQVYDDLPAFNGNRFFDGASEAASDYSITLAVFAAGIDLLQIQAVLTDLRSDRELGRLTTYRSAR
jgi:hypothetical protein